MILSDRRHGGRVAWIELAQPPGNVLDRATVAELRAAVASLRDRRDLKLVVFAGRDGHFSFGASVREHLPGEVERMLPEFHALFRELEDLSVPTAAAVRGQCLGGGCELALACGFVACAPDARMGLPEVKLAVFPPLGAALLGLRVGAARATRMAVTGEIVSGTEALAIGLADACGPDPEALVHEWYAQSLASSSAVGIRFAWRAARWPVRRVLEQELPRLEALYLRELMAHRDPEEGLRAFVERRAPAWGDV